MNNKSKTVNWSEIFSTLGYDKVREFADGDLSGRQFYELAQLWDGGPEVRNLLRSRGVDEARQLARKALSRR